MNKSKFTFEFLGISRDSIQSFGIWIESSRARTHLIIWPAINCSGKSDSAHDKLTKSLCGIENKQFQLTGL